MNSTRSPRQTHAETGRLVKVTLDYDSQRQFGSLYRIERITNEIAVVVTSEEKYSRYGNSVTKDKPTPEIKHVGDYLTERQATDLLTEPGLEVTVVPAKD